MRTPLCTFESRVLWIPEYTFNISEHFALLQMVFFRSWLLILTNVNWILKKWLSETTTYETREVLYTKTQNENVDYFAIKLFLLCIDQTKSVWFTPSRTEKISLECITNMLFPLYSCNHSQSQWESMDSSRFPRKEFFLLPNLFTAFSRLIQKQNEYATLHIFLGKQ